MTKTNRWIIALDGSYLDTPSGKLTGFSDNVEEVVVIAPFDTDSAVSFGVGNEHRTALSQYLSLDVDGVVSDWVDEDWTSGTVTYQDIADWNVWRIGLKATTKAYISKYRGGFVYFSFRFGNIVTNDKTVTYKGTFGVDNLLPTEDQTTGDYYALEDLYYTLTVDTNGKTLVLGKGMYVYWATGGYWVKVSENLVQNTCSQTQAVDPSFAINDEVDEDEINYLVSFESTIADHETRIQELEETGGTTAVGISYNGEGTNYLETKENVQSAVTELDTQLKTVDDRSQTNETDIAENQGNIAENQGNIETSQEDISLLKFKVTERDVEIKKLKKQLVEANPNQETKIEYTADEFIEYFGKTPANLPLNVLSVKGLTIKNVIENGDFSALSSNWNSELYSLAVASNILTATTGAIGSPQVFYYDYGKAYSESDKLFIKGRVKTTYSDTITQLSVALDGASAGTLVYALNQSSPTSDEWYEFETILTVPADHSGNTTLKFFIAGTITIGDTIQIDGLSNPLRTIPITNTPYASDTASQWASRVPEYIDGETSITNPTVGIVGKNLFDKNEVALGYRLNSSGGLIVTSAGYVSDYIKIKDITSYYVSNYSTKQRYAAYYDIDKNFISNQLMASSGADTELTTPSNAYYLRFSGTTDKLDIAQLNEGTTTTTCKAYHSEQVTYTRKDGNDLVMRSVGTAQDGFTKIDGILYKEANVGIDNITGIVSVDTTNYPLAKNGGSWTNYLTAGGQESGIIGTDSTTGDGLLHYELATPDTSVEIDYIGDILYSEPSFSFYQLQSIEDAGVYNDGISIQIEGSPIKTLDYLAIIDYETNATTELDTSTAVIAGDGLSFTHSGLSNGDIVYFKYTRTVSNIATDVDIEYYDSRFIKTDETTGTVYTIEQYIDNGVIGYRLTEV